MARQKLEKTNVIRPLEAKKVQYEWIPVNAGRRGLHLRVAIDDLLRLTGARVVDAVRGNRDDSATVSFDVERAGQEST